METIIKDYGYELTSINNLSFSNDKLKNRFKHRLGNEVYAIRDTFLIDNKSLIYTLTNYDREAEQGFDPRVNQLWHVKRLHGDTWKEVLFPAKDILLSFDHSVKILHAIFAANNHWQAFNKRSTKEKFGLRPFRPINNEVDSEVIWLVDLSIAPR